MPDTRIFSVYDGSIWYFDAVSPLAAHSQWVAACRELHGYTDDRSVLEEFGAPTIKLVTKVAASKIRFTDEETMIECLHCRGTGRVPRVVSLLDWWRENNECSPEKKAKWGALCNSEWP